MERLWRLVERMPRCRGKGECSRQQPEISSHRRWRCMWLTISDDDADDHRHWSVPRVHRRPVELISDIGGCQSVKLKSTIPHEECWRAGCSSPLLRPWARRCINHFSLSRMASATPDLWLPSQLQDMPVCAGTCMQGCLAVQLSTSDTSGSIICPSGNSVTWPWAHPSSLGTVSFVAYHKSCKSVYICV